MKRFYISTSLLLFCMATSYGQIKVVDDSYKTETATISEMNKPLDMEKLERIFPKYIPGNTIRLITDWYPTSGYSNAVGEKFYVYEVSEKQYVRINHTDSTVCIASMPVGYYEITGVILTSDRLDECREEALKYKIDQNERESIIIRMSSYYGNAECDNTAMGKASIANLKKVILGLPNTWGTEFDRFPIWICKDSTGQLFYVSPAYLNGGKIQYNYGGSQSEYALSPLKYILMSFYENAEKLKGQKIAIFPQGKDYIIDYISKEPIKTSFIHRNYHYAIHVYEPEFDKYQARINPDIEFLQCKDIVLKADTLLAIVDYGQGNFAVPIMRRLNKEFHTSSRDKIFVECFETELTSSGPECLIFSEQELKDAVSDFNAKQNKLAASRLKAEQEAEQEDMRRKQERLDNLTSKYGTEMASVIAEGKIKIGMTQEMCKEAWGIPNEIYTTTTDAGSTQVWMYNYKTRLYFVDNRLSIIQN